MKAKVELTLEFRSSGEASAVSSALKPDNLVVKENMRISQYVRDNVVIINIEVYGSEDIVGTVRNTVDEILAHIKSVEKVFEKLRAT